MASAVDIDTLLVRIRSNDASLLQVDVSNGRFSDPKALLAFCDALKCNTIVRVLGLSNAGIEDKAVIALSEVLRNSNSIEVVDLRSNQIGDKGAIALAGALKVNRSVKYVNVAFAFNKTQGLGSFVLFEVAKQRRIELIMDHNLFAPNDDYCHIKSGTVDDLTVLAAFCDSLKGSKTKAHIYMSGVLLVGDTGVIELAKALRGENTFVHKIFLAQNQIGEEGARALADALRVNSGVQMVDLGVNKVSNAGAVALGEALKAGSCRLGWLCLKRNQIGNAGAIAIGAALKENTTIQCLDLSANQIEDGGAIALADGLKDNRGSVLTSLFLDANQIRDVGATALGAAIKENTSIQCLDLSANQIEDGAAIALADGLKDNRGSVLTSLFLDANQIRDVGATALGEALKASSTMQTIGLSRNRIGDEGALDLANSLKVARSMRKVFLQGNPIGSIALFVLSVTVSDKIELKLTQSFSFIIESEGKVSPKLLSALLDALRVCRTSQELSLNNAKFGDTEAVELASALRECRCLNVIYLNANCIGDKGCIALAQALEVNIGLQGISLGSNHIGDDGAIALAKALKFNDSLESIFLAENQIGDAGILALAEAFMENRSLRTVNLTGNRFGFLGIIALSDVLNARSIDIRVKNGAFLPICQQLARTVLAPVHASVSNCHVHICGEGNAGKSVLHHWICELTGPTSTVNSLVDWKRMLGPSKHFITGDNRATTGFVTSQHTYIVDKDKALQFTLYDYAGQREFKINHSGALSVPDSIYIVVVPLFDMDRKVWLQEYECKARLLDWLKFIYSVMHAKRLDWDKLVGKASSVGICKGAADDVDYWSVQSIPVFVVVNLFSNQRDTLKPEKQHLASLPKATIQEIVKGWLAECIQLFNSTQCDTDALIQDKRVIFEFLPIVLMDVCQREEVKTKLLSALISASETVAKSRYSLPSCVEYFRKRGVPASVDHKILPKQRYVDCLRNIFRTYPPFVAFVGAVSSQDNDRDKLTSAENGALDYVVSRVLPVLENTGAILCLQTEAKADATADGGDLVVTDRNWLTSEVIGRILQQAAKLKLRSDMAIHQADIRRWLKDLLPKNTSILHLLTSMSLAIPVQRDPQEGVIVPLQEEKKADLPLDDNREDVLLLGLIAEPMPNVEVLCQRGSIVPCRGWSICRVFALLDERFVFVPGFFMRLFVFVHNRHPVRVASHFWSDGMVVRNRTRLQGEEDVGTVQIVISPYQIDVGGMPKPAFRVDCGVSMDKDKVAVGMGDVVYGEMNAMREYLRGNSWNLEWLEYGLDPDNVQGQPLRRLRDLEDLWFFGCEEARLNVSSALLGNQLETLERRRMGQMSLSLSWEVCDQRGLLCVPSDAKAVQDIKAAIDREMFGSDIAVKEKLRMVLDVCRQRGVAVSYAQLHGVPEEFDDRTGRVGASGEVDVSAAIQGLTDTIRNQMLPNQGRMLHMLQESTRATVDQQRGVHDKPLLMVLKRRNLSDNPALRLGQQLKERLGTKRYSVHFLCEMCGECKTMKPAASPDAPKGYELDVSNRFCVDMLQAVHASLCMLQLILQVAGLPNGVSHLGKMCLDSVECVSKEVAEQLQDKVAEFEEMRAMFAQVAATEDAATAVSASTGTAAATAVAGSGAGASSPAASSGTAIAAPGSGASQEYQVTSQHIETMKNLFEYKWRDLKCRQSGLEIARKDDAQQAWVCMGTNQRLADGSFSKSACYEKFMREGRDCLHVLINDSGDDRLPGDRLILFSVLMIGFRNISLFVYVTWFQAYKFKHIVHRVVHSVMGVQFALQVAGCRAADLQSSANCATYAGYQPLKAPSLSLPLPVPSVD
eukprot:gene23385-28377_t